MANRTAPWGSVTAEMTGQTSGVAGARLNAVTYARLFIRCAKVAEPAGHSRGS